MVLKENSVKNKKEIKNDLKLDRKKLDDLKLYILNLFSKENINKIIENIKKLRKEDIYLFYYKYRNSFYFYLYMTILLFLLFFIAKVWNETYSSFKKVQLNISNIEIVTNTWLINEIKKWKIRNIHGIVDTIYFMKYKTYDSKKYDKLYKDVLVSVILSLSSNKNYKYSSILNMLNTIFVWNWYVFDKNKLINKIKLLSSSDIDKKLSYNSELSLLLWWYLSSFPVIKKSDVLKYIDDKNIISLINKVMSKLYMYELPSIWIFLNNKVNYYKTSYNMNTAPYKNFLSYLLYPSINIWVNKFSKVINPNIFWEKYLKTASYIDLNLIKYWSDFFTTSYRWKLYQWLNNTINEIKLWKMNIIDKSDLAKIWLKIKFKLLDDKSFYWLISKLTITSNIKNIMLLNEFTFDLRNEIKYHIVKRLPKEFRKWDKLGKRWILYQLQVCYLSSKTDCLKILWCKWDCSNDYKKFLNYDYQSNKIDLKNISLKLYKKLDRNKFDYTNSTLYRFIKNKYYDIDDIDVLIWARLYDCIKNNWYCYDIFDKKYSQISNAIVKFAGCKKWSSVSKSLKCQFKFIDKFNTNYFIAYTLVDKLWKINYSLLDRLRDVYNNLPAILQLDKFVFTKNNNDSNVDVSSSLEYWTDIWLSLFYKYLSKDDYNKIMNYIWQKDCLVVTNNSIFSLDNALSYISNKYNILSKSTSDSVLLYDLKKMQSIIEDLKKSTDKWNLLNKLLANLQVYRMFKEKWYCK